MSTQLIAAFVEELKQKDEEIKKRDEEIQRLREELARQKLLRESDTNVEEEFPMIAKGINIKEGHLEGLREMSEEQGRMRMLDICLPRLNLDSVKNGTARITPVTIPTDGLPLLLEDFDVLYPRDLQSSVSQLRDFRSFNGRQKSITFEEIFEFTSHSPSISKKFETR